MKLSIVGQDFTYHAIAVGTNQWGMTWQMSLETTSDETPSLPPTVFDYYFTSDVVGLAREELVLS